MSVPDVQPKTAQAPTTNGLAIASLVLSLVWLSGLGSIVAIILGFMANAQIKRANGAQTGQGLAIAGIVLGFLGLLVTLVVMLAILIPVLLNNRG
jgi:hypothetical protein